jgi:CRISPR-associated protein Cmr6
LLVLSAPGNPSLLFDKGMDRYGEDWKIGAGEKEKFFRAFANTFRTQPTDEFGEFLNRRRGAFKHLGIEPIPLTTQTRLVVGLGLPSPLETGFLLDRLTGCPYLPGSSVKGLLRAAARLVRQEELEGDKPFWEAHANRIFGPEIAPGSTPKTGEVIFYDAFPALWPRLEIDVLTPHYGRYYREGVDPGDWDNPVPVPFLAVAPGTTFHFYLQAVITDFQKLEELLALALDWMGIGAKKSAGYGIFGKDAPPAEARSSQRPAEPPPQASPIISPKPSLSEASWDNVELRRHQGSVVAYRGKQTASCRQSEVEQDLLQALTRTRTLRGDVDVLKIKGGEYRLVRVRKWTR